MSAQWLRRGFHNSFRARVSSSKKVCPTGQSPARLRFLPLVEALEDRTLPSTLVGQPGRVPLPAGAGYAPDHILVGDLAGQVHRIPLAQGVTVAQALASYQGKPGVKYAEPDWIVHADLIPNDPSFDQEYGLNNTGQEINGLPGTPDADIDAAEAWNITTGSLQTVVADIDTGIDYTHPDLYLNIWLNQQEIPTAIHNVLTDTDGDGLITFYDLNNPVNQGPGKITDLNGNGRIDGGDLLNNSSGWEDHADNDGDGYVDDLIGWNFVNNTNDPMDDNGHGTHTSGTVGAIGNNATGVSGVNWKVQLAAMKFLDASGSGELSGAEQALNLSVAKGILISNNSWGGGGFSESFLDALNAAGNADHVFVAAAGNSFSNNDDNPLYPASFDADNIIAVAATDYDDELAWFSNFGPNSVDIAAPGVSVYSTWLNADYAYLDGTSMATPHVAGVVALLRSQNPSYTYSQITGLIENYADVIPGLESTVAGGHRLNALGALTGTPPPPPPSSVVSSSPNGFVVTPLGYIDFKFKVAMNTSSFAVANDVVSFTGPTGNLLGQITGFSWLPGNHTLRVFFNSQTAEGKYEMVIGPNILAALSGDPMDQDHDGVFGETVDDRYTASISKFLTVYYADFSDSGGAANLDGFTIDNTGEPAPGLWHLSTGHGSEPGHTPDDSMYFGTGEGPSGGGTYDVGTTAGRITSPSIDLTTASAAKLSFNYLLETDGGSFFGLDIADVQVSADGGAFDSIASNPFELIDPTGGWTGATIDLSAYVGHTIQVRFDFDTGDNSGNDFEGWYVDDVAVGISTGTLNPVFTADFSDAGGAANLDGFTIDNTGAPAPGLWHLSTGRGTQPGHSADDSMYYGFGEGPSGGGNYNAGDSAGRITSPVIDLTDATVAQLSFNYFLHTEGFALGGFDLGLVNVSANGGPFSDIASNADFLVDPTTGWTAISLDLSAYVGSTIRIQFDFATGDSLNNFYEGWYVDDVVVKKAVPAAPTTVTWVNPGSGDWNDASNWSDGSVNRLPGPADDVFINTSGITVTHSAPDTDSVKSLTCQGNLAISGGTLSLAGASTVAGDFSLSAGVLEGGGDLTVSGTMTWTGGIMRDNGKLILASSATATISGTDNKGLDRVLENSGTINYTGFGLRYGLLSASEVGILNNLVGAFFNAQGDGDISAYYASPAHAFNNQGTFTRSGTGDTQISGVMFNDNGGAVHVQQGSLAVTDGGTITGTAALTADSLTTLTLAGDITGSGSIWKTGAGTLFLSGSNTYTGGTLLSAGALALDNNSALGTGTLTLQTATIQADTAARTLANPVVFSGTTTFGGSFGLTFTGAATLNANRTLNVTNTGPTTFAGPIGESGGAFKLSKTGAGTLVLSGSNTFTGGVQHTAGTIALGSNTALGTGTFTMQTAVIQAFGGARTLANALTLNGTTTIAGSLDLTLTGPATLTANRTLTVNSTGLTTLSGNIGGAFKLSKTGNGTLKLSGNNTYSGGLTFAAGTFLAGSNAAAGTGLLTLVTCTVKADGAARTLNNALSFNGTTTFAGTLDLTFTGNGTLTGSRTLQVDSTGLTTFSGNIGQTSAFKLTKTGGGTLLLSGNNTFTGGFNLNVGTFAVGSNTAAGSGLITILGGSMRADGAPQTLANALLLGNFTVAGSLDLTFSGTATLNGTRTITVTNTGLTRFTGNIGQDLSGRGLTKAGAGTLVLSGNNTYTGSTNVNAGLLRIDGTQAGSAVIVKTGGTLGGSGTVGAVQVQAGGFLAPGASPGILNTGNINYLSSSTFNVELNGITAGSGYDQVNAVGTVNLGGSTLNLTVGFTPIVGQTFTIVNNDGTEAVIGTFAGLAEGGTITVGGMTFQISYKGGTGNDVVLTRIS